MRKYTANWAGGLPAKDPLIANTTSRTSSMATIFVALRGHIFS
jgi:hypothetical protein